MFEALDTVGGEHPARQQGEDIQDYFCRKDAAVIDHLPAKQQEMKGPATVVNSTAEEPPVPSECVAPQAAQPSAELLRQALDEETLYPRAPPAANSPAASPRQPAPAEETPPAGIQDVQSNNEEGGQAMKRPPDLQPCALGGEGQKKVVKCVLKRREKLEGSANEATGHAKAAAEAAASQAHNALAVEAKGVKWQLPQEPMSSGPP